MRQKCRSPIVSQFLHRCHDVIPIIGSIVGRGGRNFFVVAQTTRASVPMFDPGQRTGPVATAFFETSFGGRDADFRETARQGTKAQRHRATARGNHRQRPPAPYGARSSAPERPGTQIELLLLLLRRAGSDGVEEACRTSPGSRSCLEQNPHYCASSRIIICHSERSPISARLVGADAPSRTKFPLIVALCGGPRAVRPPGKFRQAERGRAARDTAL